MRSICDNQKWILQKLFMNIREHSVSVHVQVQCYIDYSD